MFAVSVAGVGLLLRSTEIPHQERHLCCRGKFLTTNPALIFAGVAAKLRDMLLIPGKS
jgi:hypothetical protein